MIDPDGPQADSPSAASPSAAPKVWPRVQLGGSVTDLVSEQEALAVIMEHAVSGDGNTLGVVSINLDHVHHFGSAQASTRDVRRSVVEDSVENQVRWLALLDGAPLANRAAALTGKRWPRLAGSDLIDPIFERCQAAGLSVGFLGGAEATHRELETVMARRWPDLRLAGCWAPSRAELSDPASAAAITATIKEAGVDVLAVCLGKPRQEQWIAAYGHASGAQVCLAFGAVVDFVAGRVSRAPRFVADHGLEWAWRLAMEPKRLARRYLIQGPPSWWALRRDSHVIEPEAFFAEPASTVAETSGSPEPEGRFVGPDGHADVTVVAVTYNNAGDIEPLVTSLRHQAGGQRIRVVVADNSSADATVELLRAHDDVITVPTGGNLGYAGGINVARRRAGDTDAVLVLNPDLELAPGAIAMLRRRLTQPGVGVVVPRLLEADGLLYTSLRREPTVLRAVGDALFGARLGGRPGALSEIELDPARYREAHEVEWATGAALLIDGELERRIGDWDEQFFLYSEEIDFMRRAREAGAEIWFEPAAVMEHRRGGSGASDQLEALMAVNRVRYAEKYYGRLGALPIRAAVMAGSVLRLNQSRHRAALGFLARRSRWARLPQAVPAPANTGADVS